MAGTGKVVVAYQHDPADLSPIHLAVTSGGAPADEDWRPALRDTVGGRLVVWVRGTVAAGQTVWLRDPAGARTVRPLLIG